MVLITNADANSPSLALWNEFLLAALMFFGPKKWWFSSVIGMVCTLDLSLLGGLIRNFGRSLPATTKLYGMPDVHPHVIAGYVLSSLVFSHNWTGRHLGDGRSSSSLNLAWAMTMFLKAWRHDALLTAVAWNSTLSSDAFISTESIGDVNLFLKIPCFAGTKICKGGYLFHGYICL